MSTIYEDQEARIAARELSAFDPITINLPRHQVVALLRGLREDSRLQPQLGRMAWMTVANIEGQLDEQSAGRAANRAETRPARDSE